MYNELNTWIKQTLKNKQITNFTDIQKKVFLNFKTNKNIIGISATGTGKTLAFLLPILNNIDFNKNLQSIIIAPTRELARQIYNELLFFKKNQNKLNIKLIIGGEQIQKQINSLNSNYQIIVSTPDRLFEIFKNNYKNINFESLNTLVIDEADMLFDLGFFNKLNEILLFLNNLNINFKTLVFSATIHNLLNNQLSNYLTNACTINVTHKSKHSDKINHYLINNFDKFHSLSVLLKTINPYFCLIFANTKKEVDEIYLFLKKINKNVTKIYGDLKTRERKNVYKSIKNLDYQYVVCTDLLSRGLDIDGASHIISWNLNNDINWYFHRAGRTGRSKYDGFSYILNDDKQLDIIKKIYDKGIKFDSFRIKNNELLPINFKIRSNNYIIDETQKQEIKKVLNQKITKKPNYKKKQKEQIKKIQNKYKRKRIEEKMNEQRINLYRKKNNNE